MLDVEGDAAGEVSGVDDLKMVGRRRPRSASERTRIVAESLVPGVRVSDVAQRWHVCSQQIYRWRHRQGLTQRSRCPERAGSADPAFVPIVAASLADETAIPVGMAAPVIEIELAGAVVRVTSGIDDAPLTTVLRAGRASALRR